MPLNQFGLQEAHDYKDKELSSVLRQTGDYLVISEKESCSERPRKHTHTVATRGTWREDSE